MAETAVLTQWFLEQHSLVNGESESPSERKYLMAPTVSGACVETTGPNHTTCPRHWERSNPPGKATTDRGHLEVSRELRPRPQGLPGSLRRWIQQPAGLLCQWAFRAFPLVSVSFAQVTNLHITVSFIPDPLSPVSGKSPILSGKVLRAKVAAHPGGRKQPGLRRNISMPLAIPFPLHLATESPIGRQPQPPPPAPLSPDKLEGSAVGG